MPKHIENTGFQPPSGWPLGCEHRTAAFAQLVATLALVVATIAIATVLSASIARAAAPIGLEGGVTTTGESASFLNLHACGGTGHTARR
jgi:hypothetical protein